MTTVTPAEVTVMSPGMREFLSAYLEWAKQDAPDDTFDRRCGLCTNLIDFSAFYLDVDDSDALIDELSNLFTASGLDTGYPFGSRVYSYECAHATHHRNSGRLAWIEEQLA